LVPALDGVTRVFISPEGQLRLLPFAALCDESGAYLVEHWQFSYLATGRDLVRYTLPTPRGTSDTVVMGDPDFGLDRGPLSTQELALKLGTTAMPSRCSADLQKLSFGRLPGTRDEAVGLAHWLGEPALCLGAAATEAALKAVRTPRVLHIATHGFFLADQPGSGVEAIPHRGLAVTVSPAGVPRLPPGLRLENPLLRSGLALAGANYWTSAVHTAGIEDGLLTALEASGLRLYGTDLVVLSACDTGLGEVRTGEGVFGLGRAFLAAGARSLIMSLWKVPDAETVALMDGFYRRWTGGAAKDVALREAQMDMIQALRARHGAAPPLLWAAFVLLGDWR
jgi:CHAT domain-containing protein